MRASALLGLAALAGCTVGPRYAGPPDAAPRAAAGAGFARGGDAVTAGPPRLAQWWTVLADPQLDALEARALAASPDLAAARARVRQAQAALREQRANRLPTFNASGLGAHARIPGLALQESESGGGGSGDLNVVNLGLNSSWDIDLFGGSRHVLEGARAQRAAAEANLADAQVSLTAAVAEAYLNARDRQARLDLARAALDKQERALVLTRQRAAAGTASRLDVERLAQQVDQARAAALPLAVERDRFRDALAALTGDEPGTHDAMLDVPAPLPLPPAAVAVGDPAALIRRRPDIRAAERQLAVETARIGQAQAARFPRLSLMGIIGIGGSRASDLTQLDDYVALGAAQLSWSILDFGRNRAKVAQAEGKRDEAEATYRATVLTALRDVEAALSRFRAARDTVALAARARGSAGTAATLTAQRYERGTTTLTDLLESERQAALAEATLAQGRAELTLAFIAVEKALGLGWAETPGDAPAPPPAG